MNRSPLNQAVQTCLTGGVACDHTPVSLVPWQPQARHNLFVAVHNNTANNSGRLQSLIITSQECDP